MKPEDYLSADDLAAVNLHVLDCERAPEARAPGSVNALRVTHGIHIYA